MKSGKLTHLLPTVALLFAAAGVHATTITYDSQLDGGGISTTLVDGATVIHFNWETCAYAGGYSDCSGDFGVVWGSESGHYAAPFVTETGEPDDSGYLTVPIDSSSGSATLTLGTTANYFGLLWGSIDTYNTIDFLFGGSVIESWTGSMVINPSEANGNQIAPSTNTYVNFFDLPTFDAVRLTSTSFAFESDNHAYATITAVPEPGSLALLAAGLLGGALVARRRTRAAAARRN